MGIKCWLNGHDDVLSYGGETGKMCFSLNCARSQIIIRSTCKVCGRISDDESFMSGIPDKAVPLTPRVAANILRDEFNTQ